MTGMFSMDDMHGELGLNEKNDPQHYSLVGRWDLNPGPTAPGNVARLLMALLITAVARGDVGLFMVLHRLMVYLSWRR
ncbi:MAG: hypothetical protein RXQ00_07115 [Caldivirga sp.]|jgi:hypothetical protein